MVRNSFRDRREGYTDKAVIMRFDSYILLIKALLRLNEAKNLGWLDYLRFWLYLSHSNMFEIWLANHYLKWDPQTEDPET